MCEWGRESVESWGRRKRSLANLSNETEAEEDMTLSQEILVLDFGDEKQSTFLKNNEALFSEFGKGALRNLLENQLNKISSNSNNMRSCCVISKRKEVP